jgi:hypothetical protein
MGLLGYARRSRRRYPGGRLQGRIPEIMDYVFVVMISFSVVGAWLYALME